MKIYTESDIQKCLEVSSTLEEFKKNLESINDFNVDGLDVWENEVITISFPGDKSNEAKELAPILQKMYPENPVIGLINDIDLLIDNAESALSMLDGMKSKITDMTGTKSLRDQILLK